MDMKSTKIQKIVSHILDSAGEKMAYFIISDQEIFQSYVTTLIKYSDGVFGDAMMKGIFKLFCGAKKLQNTHLTDQVFG